MFSSGSPSPQEQSPPLFFTLHNMSLDEKFQKAVNVVRNGPAKESSNETKLNFYKYYKQATEGDVQGTQV